MQPICNENKNIWLTINGEIYNYLEIREKLLQKGHRFKSYTDSEVLVHAYEEWGMNMLEQIDGMFAFGLWDKTHNKLILARDRFGIKPLYYYYNNQDLIFASEIKAIIEDKTIDRNLNYQSVCDFFIYRYIPSPNTIFKNIYKLPPAHYIEFTSPSDFKLSCYYTLPVGNEITKNKDISQKTDDLLYHSVKTHVRSDVPIGSFLSGGFDSSILVKYFSEIEPGFNTFSIGFQNWEKSEHQYAQIVADKYNTKHHNLILDSNSLNILPELMYWFDEPIADISIIPTYFVSKLAAQQNKAVLSGEGADELFAGYTWHQKYLWSVSEKQIKDSKKNGWHLPINNYNVESYSQAMSMGLFGKSELELLLNFDLHQYIPIDTSLFYKQNFNPQIPMPKRFQFMDIKTFMAELVLTKVDRASMANSLEVRVPFLSKNIVDFMLNLDPSMYFDPERQKKLLYDNLRKSKMSKEILHRRKQGFVGPDSYYMSIDFYQNIILNSKLISDKLINEQYIHSLIVHKDHWRLWKIAVFTLWYSKWIN
jgi:asparagine synthase (glutamine-hydrolysing)